MMHEQAPDAGHGEAPSAIANDLDDTLIVEAAAGTGQDD